MPSQTANGAFDIVGGPKQVWIQMDVLLPRIWRKLLQHPFDAAGYAHGVAPYWPITIITMAGSLTNGCRSDRRARRIDHRRHVTERQIGAIPARQHHLLKVSAQHQATGQLQD